MKLNWFFYPDSCVKHAIKQFKEKSLVTKKKVVATKKPVAKKITPPAKSDWTEVEKGKFGVRNNDPRVSVYIKRGIMRLNNAFLNKFKLEKVTHVKVLFNDKTKDVGIVEAGAKDENALKLLNRKVGVGAVLSCKKLLHRIDLKAQPETLKTLVATLFETAKLGGKDMIVFKLEEFAV
jgi:hypothetical protein